MSFWSLRKSQRLFYVCGTARLVTIASGIFLLLFLKRQRYLARRGDVRASRALLLPVFEPMITVLILSVSAEWCFLYLQFRPDTESWAMLTSILAQFSLNQFTQTGLVTFFCSRSLSHAAMLRASFAAFMLALFGFVCALVKQLVNPLAGLLMFNGGPILVLLAVQFKWVYRRRSVLPYVQYMILYDAVWCAYSIFGTSPSRGGIHLPIVYYLLLLAIGLLEIPLCVLWFVVMWNDTYFWRTGALKIKGGGGGESSIANNHTRRIIHTLKRIFRRAAHKKEKRKRKRDTVHADLPHTTITRVHVRSTLSLNDNDGSIHDNGNSRGPNVLPSVTEDEDAQRTWSDGSGVDHHRHGTDQCRFHSDSDYRDDDSEYEYDDSESDSEAEMAEWGGYEAEAMSRIRQLKKQEEEWERNQRARMRQQQQNGTASTTPSAPSSSPSSPRHRSRRPMGASRNSSTSNSADRVLPPGETLLNQGSDALLSRDVQQLIESNKRRFIDFACLEIDESRGCIGRGGSSRVYAGWYRQFPVAIKFFAVDQTNTSEELTSATIAAYAKETAIAAAFNHPSIVTFIGLCVRPPAIFLVSELCDQGSLFNVLPTLRYHPAWGYSAVLALSIAVTRSIVYLHSCGYVHRDVKSLNYMVNKHGELKLTDFGLSRMFPQHKQPTPSSQQSRAASPSSTNANNNATHNNSHSSRPPSRHPQQAHSPLAASPSYHLATPLLNQAQRSPSSRHLPPSFLTRRVGSRCWMSPEMIRGLSYTYSSDIYSLTMVLWEILTCSPPFDEVPDEELTDVIMSGRTPDIPMDTPDEFKQLLQQGWSREPAARPTAKQMLERLHEMSKNEEERTNQPPFDLSIFFRQPTAAQYCQEAEERFAEQQQQWQLMQQHMAMAAAQQQLQHQQQQQLIPQPNLPSNPAAMLAAYGLAPTTSPSCVSSFLQSSIEPQLHEEYLRLQAEAALVQQTLGYLPPQPHTQTQHSDDEQLQTQTQTQAHAHIHQMLPAAQQQPPHQHQHEQTLSLLHHQFEHEQLMQQQQQHQHSQPNRPWLAHLQP